MTSKLKIKMKKAYGEKVIWNEHSFIITQEFHREDFLVRTKEENQNRYEVLEEKI